MAAEAGAATTVRLAAAGDAASPSTWLVQELPDVGLIVKELAPEDAVLSFAGSTASVLSSSNAAKGIPDLPGLLEECPTGGQLPRGPPSLALTSQASSTAPSARGTSSLASSRRNKGAMKDALVVYSPDRDCFGRESDVRAAAVTRGLAEMGLEVMQQSRLAGEVERHASSGDEAHLLVQAAHKCVCTVVLLTRSFIDRVEAGAMGDPCVLAFTLAQRTSSVVLAAMEPELTDTQQWGCNQVLARLSGRVLVDLSMDHRSSDWAEAVRCLAWHVSKRPDPPSGSVQRFTDLSYSKPGKVSAPAWPGPPSSQASKEFTFHCFVSHDSTADQQGRSNGDRVKSVVQALGRHGIRAFLETEEAHRYRSLDEARVDGVRCSASALVFLTKKYIRRVEEGHVVDDCVAQFNLVKQAPGVIPVTMEPELSNPAKWGWNRIFAHLSGRIGVDLSADTWPVLAMLHSEDAQRWHAMVNALQCRIWHTAAAGPSGACQRLLPFVPFRDVALWVGRLFALAAVLHVCAAGCRCAAVDSASGDDLVRAADVLMPCSCGLWLLGFTLSALWHLLQARLGPDYDLSRRDIPTLALLGLLLRCAGVALLGARALAALGSDSWRRHGLWRWGDLAGGCCLLVGSWAAVPTALGRIRGWTLASFGALPFCSELLYSVGALALALAGASQHDGLMYASDAPYASCGLELAGAVLLLLAAVALAAWAELSPRMLSRACGIVPLGQGPVEASRPAPPPATPPPEGVGKLEPAPRQGSPALPPLPVQAQPTETAPSQVAEELPAPPLPSSEPAAEARGGDLHDAPKSCSLHPAASSDLRGSADGSLPPNPEMGTSPGAP